MADSDPIWMTNPAVPGATAQVATTAVAYWQTKGWVVASVPAQPAFAGYEALAPIVDAKGDILAASGNDTVGRVPVGASGTLLTADPAQPLGMRWAGATEIYDLGTSAGQLAAIDGDPNSQFRQQQDARQSASTAAQIKTDAIQVREGALTPYRFVTGAGPMTRAALQSFFDTILHGTATKAEGFIPGGQIDLDGTPIVLTGASAYSAGKIQGAGRTSRNEDGSGTIIRQTANAPIFRFDSGLSGLQMSDLTLKWDGAPDGTTDQRKAFVFNQPATGDSNPTWFNLGFERMTILRAYRGWDLVTAAGKQASVWATKWSEILVDDCKDSVWRLVPAVPVGQPENVWERVYVNNANGSVVATAPVWFTSALEGSLRAIDVEGWRNTVFRNFGGYSVDIQGCHIEHHQIDGTTPDSYMVFDTAGASHLSVRNASITGTSLGGSVALTVIGAAGTDSQLTLEDVVTGIAVTGSAEVVYGEGHFRLGTVTKANGTQFQTGSYGNVTPRVTRLGGLGNYGTLKPESAATGSRPSASAVGKGAMFYDSTLNKPIWSNGSAWTDATGTVV